MRETNRGKFVLAFTLQSSLGICLWPLKATRNWARKRSVVTQCIYLCQKSTCQCSGEV